MIAALRQLAVACVAILAASAAWPGAFAWLASAWR